MPPQAIAERLLDQSLPKAGGATVALLDEWERENASNDPDEVSRRQAEGEALLRGLANNRKVSEGAGSREIWP